MILEHSLIAPSPSLSLTSSAMASEAEFAQALSYANNQNHGQAFELFNKLAEQGDAAAQNELGYMYVNGQGVRQDYRQAMAWYQKAHAQGEAKAAHNIGVHYYNGEGVRQNKSTAKEWDGRACDLGHQKGCDEYRKLNQQGY